MTTETALRSIDLDHLDAEILLAYSLKKDRSWLLAHKEYSLSPSQKKEFSELVERRKKHEPIAYILGEKEFYDRSFKVNPSVLIPRPSTEGLIDLTLDFLNTGKEEIRSVDSGIVAVTKKFSDVSEVKTIVDIGTGSGCIAITLAIERPNLQIIATDTSEEALKVAKENAKNHGVLDQILFRQANLLDPVSDLTEPFIVVSNPPYIQEGEELPPDVRDYEPNEALFGGQHGTDIVRTLYKSCEKHSACVGCVIECKEDHLLGLNMDGGHSR